MSVPTRESNCHILAHGAGGIPSLGRFLDDEVNFGHGQHLLIRVTFG